MRKLSFHFFAWIHTAIRWWGQNSTLCLSGLGHSPTNKLPPSTLLWAARKLLSVDTSEEGNMGRRRLVLWLKEQILQSHKMAESKSGEVIIIAIWSWLYSCEVQGHLLSSIPICSYLTKSHNKNKNGMWQAGPLDYADFLQRELERFSPGLQGLFGVLNLSRIPDEWRSWTQNCARISLQFKYL